MNKFNWRAMLGIMMLVAGGLALLSSLNLIELEGSVWSIIIAVAFATGGAAFLFVLISDKSNWWAAIPGCTLVGLGLLIGLEMIPGMPDVFPVFLFLGSIGLSFFIIFMLNRSFWWAIIPGGAMVSVALLVGLGDLLDEAAVGIFFLGLAGTFALLTLRSVNETKMTWPWIPAGILGVMGIAFVGFSTTVPEFIFPALMIIAGAVLVIWTARRKTEV
ncbi:MAG TPA: hypothetical protein VN376_02500 [Longilinea sp.]|nr:hypothetical protein [Longilinea sp.]